MNLRKVSSDMPLRATVEKQNFGVNEGGGNGWIMMSWGVRDSLGASALEGFDQSMFARLINY
jgi:hypothetical protein